MLYLIGIGLWDEKDITLRGLEIAKRCDFVYLEAYTSAMLGTTRAKIEKLVGKKIVELGREQIELAPKFLEQARKKDVALLMGGDPLAATTHADLLLRAKKSGIKTVIVHNASIFTAIAETGLQLYKFGRTATAAFWEEGFKPTSFYDVVKENKKRGLHTLLLLDIKRDREPPKYMSANEAIELLRGIDKKFGDEKIVVLARAGAPTMLIKYGKARDLKGFDFGKPMHVLIVPGKLHPTEKELLEGFE